VRAPADRPISALLAILALVFSWVLILFIAQVVATDRDDGLAAHVGPAATEAQD